MADIFLSYSRDDLAAARRFAEGFEREGFSVWWDQSLEAGEAFDHVTEKALEAAKAVVVLWSQHSVDSRWVRAEATQAEREKKLVPVTIEPCKRPIMFELTQTADLSHWKGDTQDRSWLALVSGLRKHAGEARPAAATQVAATESAAPLRKITGIGIGALLLAVLITFMLLRTPLKPDAPPAGAIATATAPIPAPVTLAVLPFANLSSDPEQEYFSDGLTEEILNQLAQIKGLMVTGRTSSFSFKGKNEDLRVIAGTLGVANLLEGSIRQDGNQLRITAQLIDGKTGGHIWSQSYNREKSDVFAMQEVIARDVAKALSVKLDVGEIAGVPGMTRNVEAYDAYLAAAALSNSLTPDSVRHSIGHLQRALSLDADFSYARGLLSAIFRGTAANLLPEKSREVWLAKSDAELEATERVVPDAFYVKVLQADQSVGRGKWNNAAKLYQHAASSGKLQLVSNIWVAGLLSADNGLPLFFLFQVGRLQETHDLAEQMRARDPLDVNAPIYLAETLADKGDYAAAFSEWDRGLKLEGGQLLVSYGGLLTALAMRDRALIDRWLDSVINLPGGMGLGLNVTMKRLLDQPAKARLELHRLAQDPQNQIAWPVLVMWMAYFDDPQGVLNIFRREAAKPDNIGEVSLSLWRPLLRDMRKLPGFKDLVRDMGLVDYWKEYGWADLCKPLAADEFECT